MFRYIYCLVVLAVASQLIKSFPYGWLDDEIETDNVSLCNLLIKLIKTYAKIISFHFKRKATTPPIIKCKLENLPISKFGFCNVKHLQFGTKKTSILIR